MTNYDFMGISSCDKEKNLFEVLNKRCRGLIKKDVIESIIARLDPSRQMKIEVIDESSMKQQAKKKTRIYTVDGHINKIEIQWVRCLVGCIDFGEDLTLVEDGTENIKKSIDSKVISNPLVVQMDIQVLGEVDSNYTKLLLLL